jgi:hypothetical protein
MNCTRCGGTGFLNIEQVDDETLAKFHESGDVQIILDWIAARNALAKNNSCSCHINPPCFFCTDMQHDVQVCDCCGDGDGWHQEPGLHTTMQHAGCA